MTSCHVEVDPHEYISRKESILAKHDTKRISKTATFVNIVYRVLVREGFEVQDNVSIERLQAQHEMLNMCYNRLNPSSEQVPKTGPYAFYETRGDASIVFLPVRGRQLTEESNVERIQIPSDKTFTGAGALNSLTEFLQTRPGGALWNVPDKINFVVAPMGGSTIGQAFLFNNYCILNNLTVGGPSALAPGLSVEGYRVGLTGVHEIGHCFGLAHVFGANYCSAPQIFNDIPKQKLSNSSVGGPRIYQEPGGQYKGTNDNRDKDCKSGNYGERSCLPCTKGSACSACDSDTTELRECFMNFMDYAGGVRAMFSTEQAALMSAWLNSEENVLIRVQPVPESLPDIPIVELPTEELPTALGSSLVLPVWAIVLIGVTMLTLVVFFIYMIRRNLVK